ncbi:MAG TPA: four helix bundle protein [bacterium]|nr:four helix bundle protein [bacterium]
MKDRINRENKSEPDMAGKAKFRFEDLEIWRKSVEVGIKLLDIADEVEKKRLFRFADQIRGAALSMSNNIAEGSGSRSRKEFNQFLNIARRSTFENANMLFILQKRDLISIEQKEYLLVELDTICRMISGFQKTLRG